MKSRLDVQLCVVNRMARKHGARAAWDLLEVAYLRTLPADAEFPVRVAQLDVFVRFFVQNQGPTDLAVRVRYQRTVANHSVETVPFSTAETVHEHVFRLRDVHLPGEGIYSVRICRQRRHRWKGFRWQVLGTDYFAVRRDRPRDAEAAGW